MLEPIEKSPFYTNPEKFLTLGQKVRAKTRVYENPDDPTGFVHAEAGEEGTVVHVEPGFWPTVQFKRSGTATCVTDLEVEPV